MNQKYLTTSMIEKKIKVAVKNINKSLNYIKRNVGLKSNNYFKQL